MTSSISGYTDYNDQELAKLYSVEVQRYRDQLIILDRVVYANWQTKEVLMSMEKEMLNRGFQINNVEESIDESRSTDSW